MRVLVLFDLADKPPADQTLDAYAQDLKDENWESEAAVLSALRALGHEPAVFGVHDDLNGLVEELRLNRPAVVFNLAEAFRRDRRLEPNLAALLELLAVPFTGAGSRALQLCKDKALAKKLVAFDGVRVPRFEVVGRGALNSDSCKSVPFPALVKPLELESSMGIAKDSLVINERDARARVQFIHERLGEDAIVEEYIEGRELYVGILAGARAGCARQFQASRSSIQVLPVRELFFEEVADGDPKFATFKAKWDDDYRARWGIRNGFADALADKLERKIDETSRAVYRALGLTGYARIDLRLTEGGELVFLEANPNPSIAPDDDFAQAALKAGLSYDKLIARLLKISGA